MYRTLFCNCWEQRHSAVDELYVVVQLSLFGADGKGQDFLRALLSPCAALMGNGALSTAPVVSYYNGQQINASAVLLTETARCGGSPQSSSAPPAASS